MTNKIYVVVDKDECNEESFNVVCEARQRLVELSESGHRVYLYEERSVMFVW